LTGEGTSAQREALRRRLTEIARERGTETYAAVGWPLGLAMRNPRHRGDLGALLDAIDREEHRRGRPLLAAVVVLAQTGRPSRGFFRNARDLGRPTGEDDAAFWAREVRRVHDHWAGRADRGDDPDACEEEIS
jgi:hypothetical protein